MANLIDCPACEHRVPGFKPARIREGDSDATSRYTHKPICSKCATHEAFNGPFWPGAQEAWDETLARSLKNNF